MNKTSELFLKQIPLGPMENFVYFLGDALSKELAVIDPAWDVNYLREEAKRLGYTIKAIWLTHGHHDHTNGIDALQSTHDIPVYLSDHEIAIYTPRCKNLNRVKPNDLLTIGDLKVRCLHTPGHAPGCQCFQVGNILVAGDLLFVDGCGRCDLPGSDPKQMYNSLYNILMKLPDETVIYPGHDYGSVPFATLGELKKKNVYLKCSSLKEFLEERMGI